ncbi:MAG: NADPH-dependent assimilatory sulfite reductase hemoprotein subunit [Wenzhouxiangellaceae bacterium]|nr:NADPH-dependent assimilatory sulfite reductase hemoprotein subunit [Wenzhouxiangellaceae bacterium]
MSDLNVERIKSDSRALRGTLIDSLADGTTGAIRDADTVISKFHGIYQQDDRDVRAERREARLEPLYRFMLRVRVPGGRVTGAQWKALDRLADEVANGTLRLTSRQAIQFHGVAKLSLRDLVRGIDAVGMDSLAACGDVNRNVMCHVQPELGPLQAETLAWADRLSAHLSPRTGAWREIWVDGNKVDIEEPEDEPVYGRSYLPRKFKIGIAVPPYNDIDVFSQDIGFVAIERDGALAGFDVVAGGGMGCSHGEPETFPLLGRVIGFVEPEQMLAVAEAIVTAQRDFGDRENRKHARFKYTLDDRGTDWLLDEIEKRAGIRPGSARGFEFTRSSDRLGWTEGVDGRWQHTAFVENGRLGPKQRAGLVKLVDTVVDDLRLTPNQNLVLTGIDAADRDRVDEILASAELAGGERRSALRTHSMACVALPTCGLAMAEAERYLPELITWIEELAERHGLGDRPINIRMSGCPNGCSRPYLGEIGLVGRAPGRYNLYLGAAPDGSRLNRLVLDNADEAAILDAIDGWFGRFAADGQQGEAFGNFAVRGGLVEPVAHGSEVNAA